MELTWAATRLIFQADIFPLKTQAAPKRPGRALHSRVYSETARLQVPPLQRRRPIAVRGTCSQPLRQVRARPLLGDKKPQLTTERAFTLPCLEVFLARRTELATCRLSAKACGLSSWTCARKQILLYPVDGDPARGHPGKRDCLPLAQGRSACAHRARRPTVRRPVAGV